MSRHAPRASAYHPASRSRRLLIVRWDFPEVPDRAVRAERGGGARCIGSGRRSTSSSPTSRDLGRRVLQRAGPEESRIFDAQILMVQDEEFLASVETLIRNNQLSAETAYEFKALELRNLWSGRGSATCASGSPTCTRFSSGCSTYLLGRAGHEPGRCPTTSSVIVVAHELSPGLTVQLDRDHVVGLVSEEGTRTVARRDPGALARDSRRDGGSRSARAGSRREPWCSSMARAAPSSLDPRAPSSRKRRLQVSRRHRLELQLEAVVDAPAVTPSGRPHHAHGERRPARGDRAGGATWARRVWDCCAPSSCSRAGPTLPTENEQTDYFRRVAAAFPGQPVIVRSFDLGGDKFPVAFKTSAGGESLPRMAVDPRLPRPAGDLPATASRDSSGGGRPRYPADAAAGDARRGGGTDSSDR